jgi:hypothetical protein
MPQKSGLKFGKSGNRWDIARNTPIEKNGLESLIAYQGASGVASAHVCD